MPRAIWCVGQPYNEEQLAQTARAINSNPAEWPVCAAYGDEENWGLMQREVFESALMVAMVMHMNMTEVFGKDDFTIVKNPGKDNMEIIQKRGQEIETYKASGQTTDGNGQQGRRLGTAYQLDNGQMIYVPDDIP